MNAPGTPLQPKLLDALREALSAERVAVDSATQVIYSRDMWPRTLLDVRDDQPSVAPPQAVVWPRCTAEVQQIVRLAAAHNTPLVPWGGGSGVCGGAMAVKGGIVIDLKLMNRLREIDSTDMLACFEAGVVGQTLEDELNLRGLTLGHFPSSIYCSTLGGWIATRSAGQMSSRYGKIEDMVEQLELVLGNGEIVTCAASDSPNLIDLFVGSEGTLGILTAATLRLRRLPPCRLFRAYSVPNVATGCEGMRRVMQAGLQPAVLRLYDHLDSYLLRSARRRDQPRGLLRRLTGLLLPDPDGESASALRNRITSAGLQRADLLNAATRAALSRLGDGCVLIVGFEGEAALAEQEAALCHAELLATGADDLGPELGLRWYDERYGVSYKQSPLLASGILADTMEIATTWDRLQDLYDAVGQTIGQHALVLAHFSHAYVEGCSIYFTFAISAQDPTEARERYDGLWRDALSAAIRAGATISHHHGVGLSKSAFMHDEHGEGMDVYRAAKRALDPHAVLNPGKMGL